MQKNILVIISVVVLVVVAGGAFYGGMVYGKSRPRQGFGGPGGNVSISSNRQNGAGGFVFGEILSKDDKSITVKMQNGSSKIIFFSSSVEVGKFVSGVLDDVQVGSNVMAQGQTNADGSVTAQSIQLRPAGQNFGPGQTQRPQAQ